jgi:transglutaminase-like putative cysteine protease
MEKKRPQLNLDELHQLKWLLGGGLVLLSVWTVFYLEFDAWTLMGLTTVAVITTLVRPEWPARVPVWTHRLVFPAVVAFFIGDLWVTGEVLPAIVRLDILLLLYRGTSYRKKRDDLQVIVLGLFLIVVAGVLTVSLVFAAQILVFTACALAFLLVITLVEVAEHGARAGVTPARPTWVGVKWRDLWARVRTVTDWRVVVLGGALFAGVVGVSALLFLAIPRFQLENSLFLERFTSKKARSGFTESIKFGEVTEIQSDTSVAASVDVTDRTQIPAAPYWRMLVLDEYRDGSFRLSPALRLTSFTRERTGTAVRGAVRPQLGGPVFWTFYLESGISRYLPLLGSFEQLRFTEIQNYRLSNELGLIALRDEPVTMTAYRVEGMLPGDLLPDPKFTELLNKQSGPGPLHSPAQMLRLGVSEPDRALLQRMVREITGGAELPVTEFIRRANSWLGRRHTYSLRPLIPGGPGDALVRWMNSTEGGHCELFAGSFVLLARTAGYPTRVVTGFKGGSWNGYSNNFTLRNSDAHAWCEIFDRAAGGWRRADPTLAAGNATGEEPRGEVALARRTDRSWSARFDSLRVFWYRRIVNFDQRSQVETLQAMKAVTENSGRQLRAALTAVVQTIKDWVAGPWEVRRVAKLLALVAGFGGAGWAWQEFGRGWWRRFRSGAQPGRMDPVRVEAARWLRKISDFGYPRPESQAVTAELQRLRFGAPETWPEPEGVFRAARRTVREWRRGRGVAAGDA